jgi:hypothetical protein
LTVESAALCHRLLVQKSLRTALLVVVSLLGSLVLCVASAFAAAFAFGAVALIVPGTGTHNIGTVTGYKENAADRFINPNVACTSTDGCTLKGVDYPASFWPIPLPGWCPGLTCDTWNQSVSEGVTNLADELDDVAADDQYAGQDIIIFGYSQGGAVVSREMYNIPDDLKQRVTVVTIGNINNPQGLWSRFSFLPTIPGLNVSFNPQLPTDIGVKSINYSFEYDPVGDAPLYWGNPLAVLNALAAFEYVHGYYLVPNSNDESGALPYGYDPDTFADVVAGLPKVPYKNAEFVLIPQQGALPIFQPFLDLGAATGTSQVIKPVVALLQPVTKLLIDLGYDRTANPGIARTLSILPFNPRTFNPVKFSQDFVAAIEKGIHDATTGVDPTAVPPVVDDEPTSVLAARVTDEDSKDTKGTKLVADHKADAVEDTAQQVDQKTAKDDPVTTTTEEDEDASTAGDVKPAAEKPAVKKTVKHHDPLNDLKKDIEKQLKNFGIKSPTPKKKKTESKPAEAKPAETKPAETKDSDKDSDKAAA